MQRAQSEDVAFISAKQMVELATCRGAEAMGLGDQIGTISPGKRADLIAVSLHSLHATPSTDPYAALVYAARADDVQFTIADGIILYDEGRYPEFGEIGQIRRQVKERRQNPPRLPKREE